MTSDCLPHQSEYLVYREDQVMPSDDL
jgi:hypothetical protein